MHARAAPCPRTSRRLRSHDREPPDEALWEQVRALPAKQRAAVTLRYAADLDYTAIGAALDCTADAARSSVHEGIKKLRQEVGEADRSRTAGGRPSNQNARPEAPRR